MKEMKEMNSKNNKNTKWKQQQREWQWQRLELSWDGKRKTKSIKFFKLAKKKRLWNLWKRFFIKQTTNQR